MSKTEERALLFFHKVDPKNQGNFISTLISIISSSCSILYFISIIGAVIVYTINSDQILSNCEVNFKLWWVLSIILNVLPPLIGVNFACCLVITSCVNVFSMVKHSNHTPFESDNDGNRGIDDENQLIGTKTRIWNKMTAIYCIIVILLIILSIIACYIWMIFGGYWTIKYHKTCLDKELYYWTIAWLIVQFLFLTSTIIAMITTVVWFTKFQGK